MGVEDSKSVLAVRVSPKIGLPSIVTEPDRVALMVEYFASGLGSEAKWVVVSALRAKKLYSVSGSKLSNSTSVCHTTPPMLYSQPDISTRMISVAVALSNIGADGAVCDALEIVAVGSDVTEPSQFAADTVTVIVEPMSSTVRV